jgi:biotin transport system substrate-specific component
MILKGTMKENKLSAVSTYILENKLIGIFSFALLTAIAAQITIPLKPVPFTLQAMLVLLSGAYLGARNGAISQVVYLAIGAAGLPVFAHIPEAGLGIARFIGPTGGYLLAFPAAAFVTGYLIEKNKDYLMTVTAMFLGYFTILISGVLYLTLFTDSFGTAVSAGAAVFSFWSLIKIFVAAAIFSSLKKNK